MTVSGQYPDFVARFGREAAGNGEVVQRYMTWAPENPVSIRSSIRAAREGARSIREVLSLDIWQATNELYLWFVGEEAPKQYVHDRDEVYRQIRRSTQLNLGLVRSTMLHDTPMDILWLGVLLERIGPDRAHPRHAPPHPRGDRQPAPDPADGAVAVAAAHLLGVRRLHAPAQGARHGPRGRRVPALRGALPALAALLRPLRAPPRRRRAPRGAAAAETTDRKSPAVLALPPGLFRRGQSAAPAPPVSRWRRGSARRGEKSVGSRGAHALTHLVEEASVAGDELQQGLGADDIVPLPQPEAAQ